MATAFTVIDSNSDFSEQWQYRKNAEDRAILLNDFEYGMDIASYSYSVIEEETPED